MTDADETAPDQAAAILDELASRASAPIPGGVLSAVERAEAAIGAARHHLHAAHLSDSAGTHVPEGARLRSVKTAVNKGLRPVTSHQVPFNRELVTTVSRLIDVVEDLVKVVGAVGTEARDVLGRAASGVATVEVGQATLEAELARLDEIVTVLTARTTEVQEGLAAQRQAAGAARVREDVILRAARSALAGAVPTDDQAEGTSPLPALADEADAALVARLAVATRAAPDGLWAQAHAVAEVVATTPGAPVLDLASGRGEWLDAWTTLGLEAHGVEADGETAATLVARGHRVEAADPLAHLSAVPAGSYGVVTAALLADTVGLDGLIVLVDGIAAALRPGGIAVLSAATPGSLADGSPLWAHPRRRAVHPDLLVALAFERGYAEVDVVTPAPVGDDGGDAYMVVARIPGGSPLP